MSDTGLGGLSSSQNTIKSLSDQARTPVAPTKPAEPKSGAHLEDSGFLDRSIDGSVSSFKPSDGGLKLRVGASATNVPFVDIIDGANSINDKNANPFKNPMVQDYNPRAGASVDLKLNRERWSLGLKVNGTSAIQTEGIAKNGKDFAGIYDQAKGLEAQLSSLEAQVNQISSKLQNSTSLKRAEQIINQLNANPGSADPKMLNELKGILNSGEIQGLFKDLDSALGNLNSAVGTANTALGMIGDGTRSISADAAARGTAEITGGVRTKRYDLGNRWGVRGGIEGAVIVPLPNPVKTPNENGLPQFKSMMAKVSTQAQVTTSGIGDIQNRLSSLQKNLSSLQSGVGNTGKAVDQATKTANNIDPNNPASVASQYGNTMSSINNLNNSAKQVSTSSQNLNKDLQGLNSDLAKVKISPSVSVTTVTPTAPVGFGIKDVGATVDGPVGDKMKLSFSTGFMNPIGYLQGEKTNYNLVKDKDEKYKLDKVGSEKGNVFHDFYDPTLYAGAGVTFNDNSWYKTQIDGRFEKSLTSDVMRASGIVKQSVGPVSLRAGVLDTDLANPGTSFMYMGGLGVGSIKHPDIVTVDAATNSLTPNEVTNGAVRAAVNVPF